MFLTAWQHTTNQNMFFPHLFGGQDALDDRYSVGGRLSRSGPGSSQQVFPLQGQRDGLLLDQRGLGPTLICHRLNQDDTNTNWVRDGVRIPEEPYLTDFTFNTFVKLNLMFSSLLVRHDPVSECNWCRTLIFWLREHNINWNKKGADAASVTLFWHKPEYLHIQCFCTFWASFYISFVGKSTVDPDRINMHTELY